MRPEDVPVFYLSKDSYVTDFQMGIEAINERLIYLDQIKNLKTLMRIRHTLFLKILNSEMYTRKKCFMRFLDLEKYSNGSLRLI